MSIRYGLIGLGMMGRHHARVIRELEGAELVALADPMGDPHNVAGSTPIFDSVDGLISAGIDAAVVAVPTRFHEEVGL
ncbi:MAG: Gfo/Idh/MocA family oxidoreductase, partial [Canibacter sp.]